MKTKLLIAAVMFFAISVAALAQNATFQVSSTPVTTVASCGAAELTGDVVFTAISGSTTGGQGTITLTYSVPIAFGSTISVYDNGSAVAIAPANVSFAGNVLSIAIPDTISAISGTVPAGSAGTIRVSGVRANVAGTGVTNVTVAVAGINFLFVGGQTNLTVVSSVTTALKAITISPVGGVIVTASTGAASGAGTVSVNENFINAFSGAGAVGSTAGQIVQVTFSGVPTGLTYTVPTSLSSTYVSAPGPPPVITNADTFTLVDVTVNATTGAVTTAAAASAGVLTASSTPVSIYYQLTTAVAVNKLKTLPITVTVAKTATATLPIPIATITVTANLAPTDVAGKMSYTPRYGGDNCVTASATIVSVVSARTALMIPYALWVQNSFDTGMAIANTTTDPGKTAMSATSGATKQDGGVTFYFFPQSGITGSPTSFATGTTPSKTPGSGFVAATGLIASGSSYVAGLGDVLSAAGFTGTFWQGYVIAVCDFTNGHGQYFIGNNGSQGATGWEQGALMLVIPSDRTANLPEGMNN